MASAALLSALIGSILGLSAAILALVAALLGRLRLGVRAARLSALLSACVVALCGGVLTLALAAPVALASALGGEASERAVRLASFLSELLNCGAPALPALLLSSLVWAGCARRLRRQAQS